MPRSHNILFGLLTLGILFGANEYFNQTMPSTPRTEQVAKSANIPSNYNNNTTPGPKTKAPNPNYPSNQPSQSSSSQPQSSSSQQPKPPASDVKPAPKPAPKPQPQQQTNADQTQKPANIPDNTPVPLEGFKWPNAQNITVKIATDNPNAIQDFKDAINAWNNTHSVKLNLTNNDHADIICNTADYSNQTITNGDETDSTLGQTACNYDETTHTFNQAWSNIDINQLSNMPHQNQVWVAEHELGHALGLNHAKQDQQSVMTPMNQKCGVSQLDIDSIKKLYNE